MDTNIGKRIFVLIVFGGAGINFIQAMEISGCFSPIAMAMNEEQGSLYIAGTGTRKVVKWNMDRREIAGTYQLAVTPSGLAVSSDGATLYVTGGSPEGAVYRVDMETGKISHLISVGHTLTAAVMCPSGNMLYVCDQFKHQVYFIHLKKKKVVATVPVSREPVAADLTPDGKWLLIANLLPAGAANGDHISAVVSVINTKTREVENVSLPNGSTGVRGICVSPDGRYAYTSHVLGRYHLPTTQLERGWMNTNALSIIDVRKRTLVNTVLLDSVDLGAANPWGVACTEDGQYLCVAHAGTHELSVIDRIGSHEKLANVAAGKKVSDVSSTPEDVSTDLSFLVGLRNRIKLKGNGPRNIVISGTKAYVAEYFSDSVGIVDISSIVGSTAQSFLLGTEKNMTLGRRGERLFNDASLCFQQWQSCASCHPDGRADGLNWDLLNDGMGNPKNTKSLLLAHQTPPAMITGIRDCAETAVRSGIRYIQFSQRPEEDAVAIDAYLKSLQPVPSPYLKNGKLSKAANRGEKIFRNAGCSSCHNGALYTDMKKYDVGTGIGRELANEFDTPTLIETWRTSPYLYDGRSVIVRELLTRHNPVDKHGKTSNLSESQIDELAEFILSQ